MTQSLTIKDGTGIVKSLTVESGAYGLIPVHHVSSSDGGGVYVTSSQENPLYISGLSSVTASITGIVTTSIPAVTAVSRSYVNTFNWNTSFSGTFEMARNSTIRKGLSLFNPGPNNLYVAMSSTGGPQNGFIINNTASAPTYYAFILYPSGTFFADATNVGIDYGGYFISGSTNTILITEVY